MTYRIELSKMEFHAYHGCYDLEQKVGNRFSVDIVITTTLRDVAESDDVTKAVNYLTVYEMVREQMAITQRTIERVSTNIIDTIYANFENIDHVECRLAKLAPPLGGKLERVSVILSK